MILSQALALAYLEAVPPSTGRSMPVMKLLSSEIQEHTRYLSSIIAGLSIQAANGSTKQELKRTAKMALRHLGY
jgi:hypothetical protein